MFWALKQLGAPLRYLRIEQGNRLLKSKRVYDVLIPLFLALLSVGFLWYWKIPLGLLSETGLVPGIINLLNLLIAFFIAALAAVATFDRAGLDDSLKGEPATLSLRTTRGEKELMVLTHRQFICYLFGYLSFVSLLFLVVLHLARLFVPTMIAANPLTREAFPWVANGSAFVFFFVFWQIMIAMLLGVYFLCDRLQHLNDPEI